MTLIRGMVFEPAQTEGQEIEDPPDTAADLQFPARGQPHRLDGSKLAQTLPELKTTPLDAAIASVVQNLTGSRSQANNQQFKENDDGALASDLP